MSISRDTFDPNKNYKRVRYHQDRDLLDSELNEQQDVEIAERKRLSEMVFREGAILDGLDVTVDGSVLRISAGLVAVEGHLEKVPGAVLVYDSAKTEGYDFVWIELLKFNFGVAQDPGLINPATGEPSAERERWAVSLKDHDTTSTDLPSNATSRRIVPIYQFDRATGLVIAIVQEKSNVFIRDLRGTLNGRRIDIHSITEEQLSFEAAEGLDSLLKNIAERTYDQAGSYLVRGFDSFLGRTIDPYNVEVVTNAGRAYIQGYRFQKDLPTSTVVPASMATKSVRGEQKTYHLGQRQYSLNSGPLKESTQVEAIVQILQNITRGSVGGGQDLLTPNPVVDILEVSQGAKTFVRGVDWQQSGNYVDWIGAGQAPAIGTTYTVKWTYTRQMVKGTDYVDGGWFGQTGQPATGQYFYLVTAVSATGETDFRPEFVAQCTTGLNQVNVVRWSQVTGATKYRVYRATQNTGRTDFKFLAELTGAASVYYIDDAVTDLGTANPPATNGAGVSMSPATATAQVTVFINFGKASVGVEPVDGTNLSVDYDYYVGRKDVLYATRTEIKRLEGATADFPKLPIAPEGTLALCSIDCPPATLVLTVQNFRLTRVTMDQIHEILQDVEDLKYNDAQFQMTSDLQNRTAQTKKAIYSDDFSSDAQSDLYHPEWNARIDTIRQFVAPGRATTATALEVDPAATSAHFEGSLAFLPRVEKVLVDQSDWSEERALLGTPPEASVEVTPNIGRRGRTSISVAASNLTPNATNVVVRCDGQVVASGIHADAAGRATAAFVIPSTARDGSRTVEVADGTRSAETDLLINNPFLISRIQRVVVERPLLRRLTIDEISVPRIIRVPVFRTVWRWKTRTRAVGPIAQTFSLPTSRVISALGIQFRAKDATLPVTIQIRGVTTGLPNEVVLAEKTLAPADISVAGETKVVFSDPVYAEAGATYAVIFLTASTAYKVRIATVGQAGQRGIITGNVYEAGTLLESVDGAGWAPVTGSDLTMKLYGHEFLQAGVVQFKPITGAQFSELNLDEYSSVPEGTSLIWEYSVDSGATWDAIVPAEEEQLPSLVAQVTLRATLTSLQPNDSPTFNFKDVNLVGYLNSPSGTYVTRENELTQGVSSTKVYAQMSIPSGATISWFASNDGGSTWEPMVVEATRALDEEWTEYTLGRGFTNATGTRVRYKAVMNGTSLVVPKIHTLGATLS